MREAASAEMDALETGRGINLSTSRMTLIFYALMTAMALLPLAFATVPPFVDYPNHLARMHILANIGTDPILQQNYAVDWAVRPNLGMDILVPTLVRAVGIFDAGRLFIAATLLALVIGVVAMRRTLLGAAGFLPVLAYLALYNHMFFWGFLNYLFGIGVFLLLFSFWIKNRSKLTLRNILLTACITASLFFVHFFALCVYVFCHSLFEAERFYRRKDETPGPRWKMSAAAFLPFLPALGLTLVWLAGTASGAGEGLGFTYGALGWKLIALVSPVFWAGNTIDIVIALSVIMIAIWAVRERLIAIAPEMKWPLIGLCLLAPLVPNNITGIEIWAADSRLPIVVALLFVASAHLTAKPGPSLRLVFGVVAALFVWRVADVTADWIHMDRDFMEFRQAVAQVRPGASLLLVQDRDDLPAELGPLGDRSYWHMVSLGAIERGTFTPTQFTGHMSLRASSRRASIDTAVGQALTREDLVETATIPNEELIRRYPKRRHMRPFWGGWPKTFDYVVVVRFENRENPAPDYLQIVAAGSFFDLYRVDNASGPDRAGLKGRRDRQ